MTDTTIEEFCRELMRDRCLGRRLEPEGLAADFTRHFRVPLRIPLDDLAVMLESADMGMVTGRRLKKGLRGVHFLQPDGSYAIHYEDDQWEGGKVHTVLHETCEILHETVGAKRPGTAPNWALCQEADRFAAAVMMPPETFAAYAQATGLDAPALQRLFRCAYRSVTLRLGEAMRCQPLLAVLYERRGRNWATGPDGVAPGDFRTSAVVRTPGFGERSSPLLCGFRGRVPLPGRAPSPGSLAERVILTGQAEYAEAEATGNRRDGDGVAVAVRPVFWQGQLAKVCLVAVPYEDRMVLAPQVHRAAFQGRELPPRLGVVTVLP